MKPADAKEFWHAIGSRAASAAVVTAAGKAGPAGFFALSATHLSADPPLLMVSVDEKTATLATIRESRAFAINYLAKGSEALVDVFSGKVGLRGADRFVAGEWATLTTGAPVLKQALAVFDCTLEDIVARGQTSIVIGRLVDHSSDDSAQPLVTFRGGYL